MCWTTKLKENGVMRTAEADIPVFKVVTRGHRPFYFKNKSFLDLNCKSGQKAAYVYIYEEGKTYAPVWCSLEGSATPITELRAFPILCDSPNACFVVYEGLHSYSSDAVAVRRSANAESGHAVLWTFSRRTDGAVAAPEQFKIDWRFKLDWFIDAYAERMDCVIPKGASYFLNERGEYVSDRLRVIGFRPLLDQPMMDQSDEDE